MAGRYDRASGVWHKVKKRYVKISGVWIPVKKRYDKVNGVWVPSYTSAVEWDWSIISASSGGNATNWSYNVTPDKTIEQWIASTGSNSAYGVVVAKFTFKTPLLMHAGQTIILDAKNTYASGSIWINKEYSGGNADLTISEGASGTFTFQTDTTINYIEVENYVSCPANSSRGGDIYVTLNSDIGSFILNNSGTSD